MSEPSDYERETRARLIKVEDCMSGLTTSNAVISERLTAISARSEERHKDQLSALQEVKDAARSMQSTLLDEIRADREHQQQLATGAAELAVQRWAALRDPRVIGLLGLLILALTAPQLLPLVLSAVISDASPQDALEQTLEPEAGEDPPEAVRALPEG